MARWFAWLQVAWLLVATGCSSYRIEGSLAPARSSQRDASLEPWLLVGAAESDLTPIPGYPMGGHGPAGTIGRGVWTRLKARATFVEDAGGDAVAFVACDLWSIPGGLTDRVVELVQRAPAGRALSRSRVLLAATHTHQSPGNFSSSDAYNLFASRVPGFDPGLFEFLATRIAGAIVAAAEDRVPARAAYGESVAAGLARNRSLVPYRLDPEAAGLPLDPDLAARQAVDPRVRVLAFRKLAEPHDLVAVQVFVAVHNTALDPGAQVYQGDLFGAAARLIRWRIAPVADDDARSAAAPVVAIFNGAEGDVRPDTKARDRLETLRLAGVLADGAGSALAQSRDIDGRWAHAMRRVSLPDACSDERRARGICPAESATMGMATPGGASDGPTLFHELIWVEGVRGAMRWNRQGPKQPAIDVGDALALSRSRVDDLWNLDVTGLLAHNVAAPPTVLPLGLFRLGPVAFVALPVEATITVGRRIEDALARRLEPTGPVIVIGLANEYLSYVATPEEYEAQHYEGASTLYGPASGPLVQDTLSELATGDAAGDPDASRYAYEVGSVTRFDAEGVGEPPYFVDDGLSDLLTDAQGRPDRRAVRFCWRAARPAWPPRDGDSAGASGPLPRVAIEARGLRGAWSVAIVDARPQTDEGLDLVTVLTRAEPQTLSWCSFWASTPSAAAPEQEFRFRVANGDARACYSPAFRVGAAQAPEAHVVDCRSAAGSE